MSEYKLQGARRRITRPAPLSCFSTPDPARCSWKEIIMNNRKKKWTALLSVLLLVCSVLSMSAVAADTESVTNRALKLTGACSVPTITVVVPGTTSKTYINPKSVAVNLSGKISDAQIVSEPTCIQNMSEVPISVSVSIVGSIKSGSTMKLVKTSTKDSTSTAKQAFVFFQMLTTDQSDPWDDSLYWTGTYDADKHIVLTTSTTTKKDFITLDAAPADEDSDPTKCYGAMLLYGDCIILPKDPWTTKDGFTAKITFTFKALPYGTEVE
jgi:hypothetical protein